jgi:hypothetical protein
VFEFVFGALGVMALPMVTVVTTVEVVVVFQ